MNAGVVLYGYTMTTNLLLPHVAIPLFTGNLFMAMAS